MQRILPIAIISLLCAHQSLAASFDCAKATTRTEKMICSNLEISRVDEQLATAYKQAMGKSADKASLKLQQKQWLKSRDSISDASKLLQSYNQRITELEAGKATATTAGKINPVGTYSYREGGYSGTMVITQVSDFPVTWKALISTVEKAPSAHMCDFTATGTNLISSAAAIEAQFQSTVDDTGDEPAKFTVKFTAQGAEVDVESKGIECGMRGFFGGPYHKSMKGRK